MGLEWTKPHVAEIRAARGAKKTTRGMNENYVWREQKLRVAWAKTTRGKNKATRSFLLKGERAETQ